MKGMQYKTSKLKVNDFNDDERIVEGYASFFGNEDSDADVMKKGSFKRTIKAQGPEGRDMIKLLAQHDMNQPIGKILKLEETDQGVYMKAKFGTHTLGEDYYRMTKEGIMNEFSVGFQAKQYEENEKGGYDFTEVKLFEVSMVTVAANDRAVVTSVKSSDPLKLVKQVEDEELKHKLEYEVLKLMSETQQTNTPPVSKDAQDSLVEKQDSLESELLKMFNTKSI